MLSKIKLPYTFEISYIIFPKLLTPINPLTIVKTEAVILSLENLVLKYVFST